MLLTSSYLCFVSFKFKELRIYFDTNGFGILHRCGVFDPCGARCKGQLVGFVVFLPLLSASTEGKDKGGVVLRCVFWGVDEAAEKVTFSNSCYSIWGR